MTAQFLFANNAQTTLAASITNVATTATLAPGSGALFPTPNGAIGQQFALTFVDSATGLLNEIVYVTGRSGDAVTIERGQEGTSAIAWSAGDLASALVTAGTLSAMFQLAGVYVADTGAANAYTITPAAAITSYQGGQTFDVIPLHANTGASTISVSGLAAKPIVRNDGSALQANDIAIGGLITITYQDVLGKFILSSVNPSASSSTAIQAQAGNYAADSGAANAYVVTLAPVVAAYFAGLVVRVNPANTNTGASTLAVNGLAAKNIVDSLGNALVPGDIVAGYPFEVIYNGTAFVRTSFSNQASSMGTTGYSGVPGSKLKIAWTTFSIASLPQNTNTIAGTVWQQQGITLPIGFASNTVWMFPSMLITANGQCIFAACQGVSTGGCTVYVTATAAADLPITGLIIAFGY